MYEVKNKQEKTHANVSFETTECSFLQRQEPDIGLFFLNSYLDKVYKDGNDHLLSDNQSLPLTFSSQLGK